MLLFGIAIAPVIAIVWYILFKDKLNKEPVKMLIFTFLFGVVSVIPAVLLEVFGGDLLGNVNSTIKAILQAFIVVAFSEELCKYFFLRKFVFNRNGWKDIFFF